MFHYLCNCAFILKMQWLESNGWNPNSVIGKELPSCLLHASRIHAVMSCINDLISPHSLVPCPLFFPLIDVLWLRVIICTKLCLVPSGHQLCTFLLIVKLFTSAAYACFCTTCVWYSTYEDHILYTPYSKITSMIFSFYFLLSTVMQDLALLSNL